MKRISPSIILPALTAIMTSCSGMLMSTDFGIDDYGPSNNWYWSPYNGYFDGPTGFYGPTWGTPPPPPPVVVMPPNRPNQTPPANGSNRPNTTPQRPPASAPSGTQRPGNMGQGPAQSTGTNTSGSSGTHRGR